MRESAVFTAPTSSEQLLRCALFKGLSYKSRQTILSHHQIDTRGAGQLFISEGVKKDSVYLLCKGSLKYGHPQVRLGWA